MQTALKNPGGPIVVLGASYAQGWKFASVAGVPVINRGVAGEQSFEMLARFDRDVASCAPRAVILWGFINDLFRAGSSERDRVQAHIRDSYVRMIELARRSLIQPVLATEVTVLMPDALSETLAAWVGWLLRKQSYQDRINQQVMAMNRWLIDLARQECLALLDIHAAMADERGRRRRPFTQKDGSHISETGYAALTAYAKPILETQVVKSERIQL